MRDIKIGIGITTYTNTDLRLRIARESIAQILSRVPNGSEVVIVDDHSTYKTDYSNWNFFNNIAQVYNPENRGVARSKNKCLEVLIDRGCTDLFLFDDDVWFSDAKYYYEYAYAELPHFNPYPKEHIENPKKIKSRFIFENQKYIEAFPYGSCLYFQRELIEKIGGYNILMHFGEEHRMMEEAIYRLQYTPKGSFDFYRPNNNYPVQIHPNTFHSQASSLPRIEKQKYIKQAQSLLTSFEGLKCPYKESEYEEFLNNVAVRKNLEHIYHP